MLVLIPDWRMCVIVICNFISFRRIVECVIFSSLWEAIRLCWVLYVLLWIPSLDLFHHVEASLELIFNLDLCSDRKVHGRVTSLTVFPCLWISWIDRFNTYWMTESSWAHCFLILLDRVIQRWKLSMCHRLLIINEISIRFLDSYTTGIRYTLR